MIIQGITLVSDAITVTPFVQHKAVFNEKGIVFGTTRVEHKTLRCDGIFYADEGAGNAVAVILDGFKFEIRRHPSFTLERIRMILKSFAQESTLKWISRLKLTYGGRNDFNSNRSFRDRDIGT